MLTTIINPQKISLETIRHEIAKAIKINAQKIIKLEYWKHQIWVNISGKGGRIVSYRALPAWLKQITFAIRDCDSLEKLQEFGELLRIETRRFSQYYAADFIHQLKLVWGGQRHILQDMEERTRPMREHQQKAQEWLDMWKQMINEHCKSVNSLQYFYPEMESQSKEFEDLPKVIEELLQTFQQRWRFLSNE